MIYSGIDRNSETRNLVMWVTILSPYLHKTTTSVQDSQKIAGFFLSRFSCSYPPGCPGKRKNIKLSLVIHWNFDYKVWIVAESNKSVPKIHRLQNKKIKKKNYTCIYSPCLLLIIVDADPCRNYGDHYHIGENFIPFNI